MLSSPYPIPPLRSWRVAMVTGWTAGIGAGAWVLASPPVSYEGIGLALTITWGIMLALGSALVAIGHLIQSYKIETPGLTLSLGGIVVYTYLSWEQVVTTSPGSGPRALLLVLLACLVVGRIRVLLHLDREARHAIDLREGHE